jgi:hypothetical protein
VEVFEGIGEAFEAAGFEEATLRPSSILAASFREV